MRASRGCDGAVENRNKSIAGGFDQPSVVLQNTGSYEFALDTLYSTVRSFFIDLH
jgi:hypothetical protein